MANKSEVYSKVNKAYRVERGLVGEPLDPGQKAELVAEQEKAWAAAGEATSPAVAEEPATPKKIGPCTANLTTLGTRTETRIQQVTQQVVDAAGNNVLSNNGLPVVRRTEGPVQHTSAQSMLNYEEALTLGDQEWKPFGKCKDKWTCVVGTRRFLIPAEVYEQLCQA